MYSRREIATATLAGLAAPVLGGLMPAGGGVRLGVQTSSFRGWPRATDVDPIDALVRAVAACGVAECELAAAQVEAPFGGAHAGHHSMSKMSPQMMRRELRKWRLRTPLSYYRDVGARFETAGIRIGAYNYSPDGSFSDEEIDRGFEAAKALGADMLTASTTPDLAKRMAPIAARHRTVVALQGVDRAPELSPYFKTSLDIGSSGNHDAVAFVREHHRDIANLHLTDRRSHGENAPWGDGNAPIREVLQLLKRERWPMRAYIQHEYAGGSPADEIRKCVAYATQALE